MPSRTRPCGFTIADLLAVLAAITVLLVTAVPVIGRVGADSGIQTSLMKATSGGFTSRPGSSTKPQSTPTT